MKKRLVRICLLTLLGLCSAMFREEPLVYAEENGIGSNGAIQFTGNYDNVGIKDPENPETNVDPGTSPHTTGKLRIDFVPQFNFSREHKRSNKNQVYSVNGQLFHGETKARGNFVQISDYRGGALGWTLQLKQETQFQNSQTANARLNGAILSLDKSWTNSTTDKAYAPIVSGEVIHLENIGDTYIVAQAKQGTGAGTWSISFGASADNPMGLETTLKPRVDRKNQPMLDPVFEKKQIQENNAITLSVPGATKKDPVPYTTVLTWTLAELP